MAAPLGFKTFNTGDVLSAADTNGYLMQGVLVFADAAARSAAITSPQEGQTSYLKDTDVIQVYSGSAWVTKSGGSSPLTTKGDLYTYSTTDARLPVGTNGHTLVADSSTATGLAWATPAGASFVGCLAQISGSQTISHNTQTKKTFTGADVYDTDAFHDPSSNDTRITIPAGLGGYYLIYGAVTWDNNTSGRRYITFTKNNADLGFTANAFSTATNTIYPTSMVSVVVNLSAGDYIELEIWQSTGGNLNTDNGVGGSWFGVAKL
jgi:hypothetical protein